MAETQKNKTQAFVTLVLDYYQTQGRHDLPWRIPEPTGDFDPYKIMVSELMLQQTQVTRVIPKYHAFLDAFPTVEALAAAELGDVLRLWTGLGYNRRAKFLWQAAQTVCNTFGGHFPETLQELTRLPGIGKNTAGAILAYAFNQPVTFIETNVRTVYIHHFFGDAEQVTDAEILPLVELTVDRDNPRLFYWALMDYGTFLKASIGNAARRSKHYSRQSPFEGSLRQIRGRVIRLLSERSYTVVELERAINDDRLSQVLVALSQEGLIRENDKYYRLA